MPLVSNIDLSHINKNKSQKRELSSKTQSKPPQAANGRGLFASTFLRATAQNALERSVTESLGTQ